MPPRRRNTRQKAVKQLTEEEQMKRDQCDLLIKDLEKNMETIINEARREKDALISNAITMYKLEMMKLPTDVKNMRWDDYFNKSVDQDNNILNVSNVVDNCLDDTVCVKVDQQMDMLKSAMKTAKKKGRPKKENDPGTVRKSSRSKSADQTVGGDTVTRTSSRSRTRGLTDASNLQTPAQGRSRRGMAVPETPANSGPPSYVGMTPMVTPKFDTTNLSRTVTRVARNDEVLMSLSGSPVAPSGPRSKLSKSHAASHVMVPVGAGQTLNLPYKGDFDLAASDLNNQDMEQMELFAQQLANKVAEMRKAKEAQS